MTGFSAAVKGGLFLLLGAVDRLRPARDLLPILNYHAIDEDPSPTSLPPRRFARQMAELAARGTTVVTFREALALLAKPGPLPANTVCLTFDDGLRSVYSAAWPVLAQHGFRATVFLTTGAVGNCVSWERDAAIRDRPLLDGDQIGELHAGGVEMGGHTVTHPHMTECDDEALEREIVVNRESVAALTGEVPVTFAYPYGDHDDRVISALRGAGYAGACTVRLPGRVMSRDPFRVERIDVSRLSRLRGRLGKIAFRSCLSGVFADYVNIKSVLPFVRTRTFEYKERKRRDEARR
jgi:peptidoglycan/xylan/chitin deacetylase (PgdA/CDA1 family)